MRIFVVPFVLAFILLLVIDYVIMRKLWKTGRVHGRVLAVTNGVVSLGLLVAIIVTFLSSCPTKADVVARSVVSARLVLAFLIVSVPKFLWGLFYGLGSIKRMRHDLSTLFKWTGNAQAAVSPLIMLYGTFFTPYKVDVTEVECEFAALPQAFDGYRIAQFSDAHLGTFNGDTAFVSQFVDAINAQKPDAICFTGDLVSMTVEEARPYVPVLKRLHARDGVFTILGNHDYAMYMKDLSDSEKAADVQELCALQRSLGWTMLNNSASVIKHGSDSIAIVGTDNYGKPPYPNDFDYKKASQGLDGVFKVHLQHNPQAWRPELLGKDAPLTLSGHTHAMQFCINLFGYRWSPASFIYDEWGGTYQEGDQVLYVNTGIGMVGPPFRIGVQPEVTVITLHRKK